MSPPFQAKQATRPPVDAVDPVAETEDTLSHGVTE